MRRFGVRLTPFYCAACAVLCIGFLLKKILFFELCQGELLGLDFETSKLIRQMSRRLQHSPIPFCVVHNPG